MPATEKALKGADEFVAAHPEITHEENLNGIVDALFRQTMSLTAEVARLQRREKELMAALAVAEGTDTERVRQIAELERERNYWRGRRLKKTECGTLHQESVRYIGLVRQKKRDRYYKKDVINVVERFVREVGQERSAADVEEQEVESWLAGVQKRDGSQIGETRRKFIRTAVLAFMAAATRNAFDRKAVPPVTSHSLRREQKEIVWLERPEAEKLVGAMYRLYGQYWGDLARIQLDQGWRPKELIMLQADLVTDRTVTLDVLEGEPPKTGKRTVQIPTTAQEAVNRRVAAGHPLLFPRQGVQGSVRRPRRARSGVLHGTMWEPTVFDKTYLALLRAAAKDVDLKKPIDCRILRRSFGSLQLRAGKRDVEVAALMGDRPETIRRHYARIVAEEVPIDLAPMLVAGEAPPVVPAAGRKRWPLRGRRPTRLRSRR